MVSTSPKTPTSARTRGIKLEFGQATDPGLDPAKAVNEDSCGYAETAFGHLFVVCDGMGGHAGGKQASDIAIRTIFDHVGTAPVDREPNDVLSEAIETAAGRVFDLGGPATNQQRPGSTCVALLLHDGVAHVAHVGDSRGYAIRGEQVYRLTKDHSMVQELIDSGALSEREAIGHPDSNKITRALGMAPTVDVELRAEPMELNEGDVFLLASDGLTDLVDSDDFLAVIPDHVARNDVPGACAELVALANRRGGFDNITLQLIHVLRASLPAGHTLPQEPSDGVAGSRVATTIDGAPVVSDTVVQEPQFATPAAAPITGCMAGAPDMQEAPTLIQPAKRRVATTKPEPPPLVADPVVRPPAGPQPVARHFEPPDHFDPPESEPRSTPTLVYVVVGMAVAISVLLILLIWALFYR
ncbi:MAG: hypothetical protein DRI90_09875 [Deltaproteobacteria bacterium]|nr:MAG: hypothetical protein DRI90_09875 [Deltaproteobacteria bacterium]